MDNVMEIFSKFKDNLGSFIDDYKNKLNDIEKEEEFIRTLGDIINYSKSDVLLLPFYDESILTKVFEHIFPLSNNEIKKIKTAKYLIEASKNVDKNHFLQYNNSVNDIEDIFNKISEFYERKLNDESLKTKKETYEIAINNYTSIYDKINSENFNSFIEDVDLFEKIINDCNLEKEEINTILNVAIKDNLNYLDNNGIINVETDSDIIDLKEENNRIQSDIRDLNNLLGE